MEMNDANNRFLAIDQGNSFIKLSLFEGDCLKESMRVPSDAEEKLFAAVEVWHPRCGAFCSVGKIDPRMVESLRLALDGRLLVVSRSTRLPIGVEYSTPSTLGLDRLALAAGAERVCPGECVAVVDAGTAVTIDVVDAEGVFRGGRITSGMHLRFEALHHFTAALPLVSERGDTPLLGYSTDTAIRSGVVLGLADEVVETFRRYKEHFGCSRLLLTGGDAPVLSPFIVNRIPADHVPDLMALGLLYIYEYNENIN